MKLARTDFTGSLFKLLKETFEEGGHFFLQKDTAVLETLDAITPEVASREPFPGAPSIAGHCAHLDYPMWTHEMLDWQTGYIEVFLEAVRSCAEKDGLSGDAMTEAVARRMKQYLPGDDLEFLMRLSVEPIRARLASMRPTA